MFQAFGPKISWRRVLAAGFCGLAGTALAQIRFVEVTQTAGIDFIGSIYAGVVAADLTGDGYPELFFPANGGAHNALYRNNADGTFTEVGQQWGVRIPDSSVANVLFDYDSDGLLDMALSTWDAADPLHFRLRLLRNVGGAFVDATSILDRNEYNDRFLRGVNAFDVNGDGRLDLFACMTGEVSDPASRGLLYINDGSRLRVRNSCIQEDGAESNWSSVTGDFNHDGRTDLLVPEDFAAITRLYLNVGGETLHDVSRAVGITTRANDMGAAAGDYDNDGDLDLYVTNISPFTGPGGNRLLRNEVQTGEFRVTDVAAAAGVGNTGVGWGCTFLDCDNDGRLDLAAVASNGRSRLFRSRGDGTFENITTASGFVPLARAYGLVALDYDLDGDLDLAVANDGRAQLFRNDSVNANRWLLIELVDRTGRDPFAVGARIHVTAGSLTMMRQLITEMSMYGQEPFMPHFGLGSNTRADRVEIEWPDGSWSVHEDVPAGAVARFTRVQGDLNWDGVVDAEDIPLFIDALAGATHVEDTLIRSDMNRDGSVNLFDIQPFVEAMPG